MPTYHVHIASGPDDPFPPVAELATIEADDPRAALEKLSRQRIVGEPGAEFAWLRVVVEYRDGGVFRALSQQVPLVPVPRDN